MTKRKRTPIMSASEVRFMAFEGLVQWTAAVVVQAGRIAAAQQSLGDLEIMMNPLTRRLAVHRSHTEDHLFVVAAYKIIEYREWLLAIDPEDPIDFTPLDDFSTRDIKDLRNMREHVVDYFNGDGGTPNRWRVQTADFDADASSVVGNMIGGRLDWLEFSRAAERLLQHLLSLPMRISTKPPV